MPTSTSAAGAASPNKTPPRVRPRRDFAAMEATRMRAADLFAKGVSQADIGRELGISHQSISDWHKQWLVGGKQALKRTGQPGRPRKVTDAELAKVERALQKGPKANGYPTDLWTLARVAEVIEKTTGVKYHPGHVWKVLRSMGWSRQRPARQAAERDDEAIEQWVNERWARGKKTPGPGTPGLSAKTKAGSPSSPQ